jgi:hypothetical protein
MTKLYPISIILFLISCSGSNYYQVFKTIPENGTFSKDKIIFEDKNCIVAYNLWEDGGDVGFSVFNKTESDITIDLTKTFFVINGVSYEYFQNRTFSKTTSSGTTHTSYPYYYYYWNWKPSRVSGTNSTSYSTSFSEKSELTIPTLTSINISDYHVTNSRFTNCDLPKYPSRKNVKTLKYDRVNSPFVFYNLITYKLKTESSRIENKFYVSEITNLPSSELITTESIDSCGKSIYPPRKVFKNSSPDKFYVSYAWEK